MHFAGVSDSDDRRLAVDVIKERGLEYHFYVGPVPGELWDSFAARMGLTRRETARANWGISQSIDVAYGLPRDPEPQWTSPSTQNQWDTAPWLKPEEHASLRAGAPLGGPLVTRLGPWERLQPAVEKLIVSPPAPFAPDLGQRSEQVASWLASLIPPTQMMLAHQAATPGVTPATVGKYLKKGFELAWENKKLILVKGAKKAIPVLNAIDTARDAYNGIKWLLDYGVPAAELTGLQYQFASNTWVYHWPGGAITDAPAPG